MTTPRCDWCGQYSRAKLVTYEYYGTGIHTKLLCQPCAVNLQKQSYPK